jgi:serine/threonine protein kinase/WD40 repeat protein/Tfp pilus assembly protein PilF
MPTDQSGLDPSGKYALLDELADDFAERYRRGERPALGDYIERYPDLAEDIRELFPALVQVERADQDLHDAPGPAEPQPVRPVLTQVGDYRILSEVGRGGMGVVYEAEQQSLGRRVALKLLPLAGMKDAKTLLRFQREARAAAKLHHTNIVPVFEVGQESEVCFYAMQFIQGQALDQIIDELRELRDQSRGPNGRSSAHRAIGSRPNGSGQALRQAAQSLLTGRFSISPVANSAAASGGASTCLHRGLADVPAATGCRVGAAGDDSTVRAASASTSSAVLPGQADLSSIESKHRRYAHSIAHIGHQVAGALAYAHGRGVIHRDIKPSNLLLDAAGVVWVTDFGLAKTQDEGLTNTGDILGTFRYMAPERFRGEGDARADIYALGLTLYELLVLKPAFRSDDRLKLVEEVKNADPPRPRALDPRIPRDLETIILKAIDKEPQRRYSSAESMADDLRRFLADEPVQARRIGPLERLWRWQRRNRAIASLAAVVLVLLVTVAGVSSVASMWLRSALCESERANEEARAQLWDSLLSQARASRMTRQPGQRLETLRAIRKALELPVPAGRSRDELRTEAIAALMLPDVEVVKEWESWQSGTFAMTIDRAFRRYARADKDGNVRIHRLEDDVELCRLPGFGSLVDGYRFAFSPDGQYFHTRYEPWGVANSRLWRLDGDEPAEIERDYWDIAFRPDSRQAAITDEKGIVRILDLASGRELARWDSELPRPILRWNPRYKQLALRAGTRLQVVEAETGKVLLRQTVGPAQVHFEWHPDGDVLAIGDSDRKITLIDARTGSPVLSPLEGHKNAGMIFNFNKAGDRLLSNEWGSVMRLWDTRTGRPLLTMPGWGWQVEQMAPPDCGSFLSVNFQFQSPRCRLLRWRTGHEFCTIAPANGPNQLYYHARTALHPDGALMAIMATTDHEIALVDIVRGAEVARLPFRGVPVCFEPDGSGLWTSGHEGLLRWPMRSERARPAGPSRYQLGPPTRVADFKGASLNGMTVDARYIVLCNHDRGALLWQREPNRKLTLGPQSDVYSCAVSPDGCWVATGSHTLREGSGAKVWDAVSGRHVADLPVGGDCEAVGFSPNGKWLVATGGAPRLWEVGTWKEGPALGGTAHNPCFAFSADGKLLALGDMPGVVRLVVPDTGKEVARLPAPEQTRLMPVCFTPDGGRLVTVGPETSAIHIFDLRAIRAQLADLHLDWEAPPLPPAPAEQLERLQVDIELGNFNQRGRADDLVGKSRGLLEAKKHAEALAALRQAVQADPKHALAHNNLAWQLCIGPKELRNPKEALASARKAVELDDRALYINTLGVALYRNDEFAQAVPVLERSLSASKGESDGFDLFFLAMCHHRLRDAARAKDHYDRAVKWFQEKRPSLRQNWIAELTEFQAEVEALLAQPVPLG